MSSLIVEGKARLSGSIAVGGNKNEALPAIAAALLCPDSVTLTNLPDIGDIRSMLAIAGHLGADVSPLINGTVTVRTPAVRTSLLPLRMSSSIRGSVVFASALLARTGEALVPQPGGDAIGRRRLDTHFQAFEALGAKLTVEQHEDGEGSGHTCFRLHAPHGLKGAEIYLDETSVTATENALIAAAGAHGTTVIVNAASEPHVQGLCALLAGMGARISGAGSNVLTVLGAGSFKSTNHALSCDYIEAGSLIGLAAATRSELTITRVSTRSMRMILHQFERIGVVTEVNHHEGAVHVPAQQPLAIRKDLGGAIPKIEDAPWPGFPADLMSIMLVVATQSEGTCLVHEKMFESRLFFVDSLIAMGAQVILCDPHRAVVVGRSPLFGSTISSPDIRAGMALLIAALAAEGKSVIHNVEQIDRGYHEIDKRLNALGARIIRVAERRKNHAG